jgi:hypothetical protein
MSDTVRIKSCASRQEADLLKSLLESNGVLATIVEDNYVGVSLPTSNGVDLLVLNDDAELSRQILEELGGKSSGNAKDSP